MLESENGAKATNLYNSLHLVDVGMEAPDFTLPTPDGKQIHFKDFLKGKKCVLVDFWASWCGWCRKENPNVRAAYDEFKDKGFDVISVSVDTKDEAWRKALDEGHIPATAGAAPSGWATTTSTSPPSTTCLS